MKNAWKKRVLTLALLAALAVAYLGASSLLEAYTDHTCDDAHHCTVCGVLHLARQVLQNTGMAALVMESVLLFGRAAGEMVRQVRQAGSTTLVSLKVKMTD